MSIFSKHFKGAALAASVLTAIPFAANAVPMEHAPEQAPSITAPQATVPSMSKQPILVPTRQGLIPANGRMAACTKDDRRVGMLMTYSTMATQPIVAVHAQAIEHMNATTFHIARYFKIVVNRLSAAEIIEKPGDMLRTVERLSKEAIMPPPDYLLPNTHLRQIVDTPDPECEKRRQNKAGMAELNNNEMHI